MLLESFKSDEEPSVQVPNFEFVVRFQCNEIRNEKDRYNLYLPKILCYNNIDFNPFMFPIYHYEVSILPRGGTTRTLFFYILYYLNKYIGP